jgi:hypothetical protein
MDIETIRYDVRVRAAARWAALRRCLALRCSPVAEAALRSEQVVLRPGLLHHHGDLSSIRRR